MNWLINLVKTIATLPNTFWGILILGASMYVAVKFNRDTGYYFAAIGSTLLGIGHTLSTPNTVTTIDSKPPIKVESNASDTSGKD